MNELAVHNFHSFSRLLGSQSPARRSVAVFRSLLPPQLLQQVLLASSTSRVHTSEHLSQASRIYARKGSSRLLNGNIASGITRRT